MSTWLLKVRNDDDDLFAEWLAGALHDGWVLLAIKQPEGWAHVTTGRQVFTAEPNGAGS